MVSAVAGSLKGGGDSKKSGPFITGMDIVTPALDIGSRFSGTGVNTVLTRKGSEAQTQFDTRFPRILSNLDTVRDTIKPGFSDLRKARIESVRAAKEASLSNLGEQVAQRRLQGSSLETNLRLQTEKTFAAEEANQVAQSFIDELTANSQILAQELGTIGTGLDREFTEAGIASSIGTQFTQMASQGAAAASQLAAQEAQGQGELLGSLLNLGVSSFSQGGPFGAPFGGSPTKSKTPEDSFLSTAIQLAPLFI